eukprot:s9_g48.t1
MAVDKALHPERQLDDGRLAEPVGYLIVYVDDILCTGPERVVTDTLAKIQDVWQCSPAEWVSSESWVKFCGLQMRWSGGDLLLGQPDFAREMVARHGPVAGHQTPLPRIDTAQEPEETIDPTDVKKCQQVLGELLWLATRSRPDISYAVSLLSGLIVKCPTRVWSWALHVVSYIQETWDYALKYSACSEESSLKELTVLSDASHAPQGLRGHQGILAMWGNALVQWESRRQPFAALSSTEAELIGYVDAITMGESLQVVLNILQTNTLAEDGTYLLKGDSLPGIQLLLSRGGPWRTRHLRLRSYVLRERLANKDWKIEHTPGASLCADLLTKAVVTPSNWEDFRRAVGLVRTCPAGSFEGLHKVAAAMVALSSVLAQSGASSMVRTASAVGLSALTAFVACGEGVMNLMRGKKDPSNAGHKSIGHTVNPTGRAPEDLDTESRCQRENEPWPDVGAREDEPASAPVVRENEPTRDSSPSLNGYRLCAFRPRSESTPQPWQPWSNPEFGQPPHRGPDDLWLQLSGGWVIRTHRTPRSRLFHPIHRSCPVSAAQLEDRRVSVIWFSGSRGWQQVIQEDVWQNGQTLPAPPVEGTWLGWTFFRLREVVQDEGGDAAQPRIHPDNVVWISGNGFNRSTQAGLALEFRWMHVLMEVGRWQVPGVPYELRSGDRGQSSRHGGQQPLWRPESNPHSWRPTSSSTSSRMSSSMASSSVGHPGEASSSFRPAWPAGYAGSIPPGSAVIAKANPAPVTRWSEGPTLSIREGETERMATLRVLGAPGPPTLGRRQEERPERKRERYLTSNRSNVSDDELWCFIHGEPYDPVRSDYEETIEHEEGSDGDFSLVTEQIEETPRRSDPAAQAQPHDDEVADLFCSPKLDAGMLPLGHCNMQWGECGLLTLNGEV